MNSDEYSRSSSIEEVSLYDVFCFFRMNWPLILSAGFVGLLCATIFLVAVPAQYESTALVEMGKTGGIGELGTVIAGPRMVIEDPRAVIEDPSLLIERLRIPSTYSKDVIRECGLPDSPQSSASLARLVQTTPNKRIVTAVEISIRRSTPELANQCLASILEMIKQHQAEILQPHLEATSKELSQLQIELRSNLNFLNSLKTTDHQSAAYFSMRDQNMFLLQIINSLKHAINQDHQPKLVAPIYVSSDAIFPKKPLTLILGSIYGLILGLLIAGARKLKATWREKSKA